MEISYRLDLRPATGQVIDLYDRCGLQRPTTDPARIQNMIENASLLVTAWDKEKLVGIARSMTDWVWCCYLADLAVHPDYQKLGIGKRLIEETRHNPFRDVGGDIVSAEDKYSTWLAFEPNDRHLSFACISSAQAARGNTLRAFVCFQYSSWVS